MKTWNRALLPFLCAASWIAFGATATIDPNLYLNDVKFLASPQMRGRATGSPELEKAAAFIAGKFKEFGLKPVDGKSYYQAFQATTSAGAGQVEPFRLHRTRKRVPRPRHHAALPRRFHAVSVFAQGPDLGTGGVRRLRHHGARIPLRRLRGPRREGQAGPDPAP